jgi:hypothetical protein
MHKVTREHCEAWLSLDAEIERLTWRWQALEALLMRKEPEFDFDDPERTGRPEASGMVALAQKRDRLDTEAAILLQTIIGHAASNLPGSIASPKVALQAAPSR